MTTEHARYPKGKTIVTVLDERRDLFRVLKSLQGLVHEYLPKGGCPEGECQRCDEDRKLIADVDEILERIGDIS